MQGSALLALLLLVASAAGDLEAGGVAQLDAEEAPKAVLSLEKTLGKYKDAAAGMSDTEAVAGRDLLLPGPTYGLPGYKESHDWVKGVDFFNPVVFDAAYYQAKYKVTEGGATQAKAAWFANMEKNTVGNCHQGNSAFSLDRYAAAYPDIVKSVGSNCGKMMKQYLETGLFEGKTAGNVLTKLSLNGKNEFLPAKGTRFRDGAIQPATDYTYTFWYRADAKDDFKTRSVLFYGKSDDPYPRSPAILQLPSTKGRANPRLSFVVSQTNDADFTCSPAKELPLNTWTFLTLAVSRSAMTVYYNGEKQCDKKNTAGYAIPASSGQRLYASDPYLAPATGKIRGLKYFAKQLLTPSELGVMMAQTRPPRD